MPKQNKNTHTNRKKWSQILLGVIVMLFLCLLGLQLYGKQALVKFIKKNTPYNIELSYDDLDINILFGSVDFYNLSLTSFNKKSKKTQCLASFETLEINNVSYWSLWNDKRFKTETVKVKNANFKIFKEEEAVRCSVDHLSFEISEVSTDSILLQNKIPFNYKNIDLELQALYLDLSRYETLKVEQLVFKNDDLDFKDLAISSKYDKETLSKKLVVEHDYVDLKVPNGHIKALKLETIKDSFSVSVKRFDFNNSELHLYRNKLLPDDFSIKTLYGTRLEKLPVKLDINKFFINNADIYYSEKVDLDIDPVSISFETLDAEIDNLSNTNTKKTDIEVHAKLMGEAPLEFHWDFYSKDPTDAFNASAFLKDLDAVTINPFLESQAKVRALGVIHEMYFTIQGNNFKSTGDMKMNYEDFKFSILDEDQLHINKTLTALVNIFTNDGSNTDANGYRYGAINVDRDRTKSFFNYLWINTKDGLKNTVVGNGKK